jgi:hypothetical protein
MKRMMNARIELRGEELFCGDTGEVGGSSMRPLPQEALSREAGPSATMQRCARIRCRSWSRSGRTSPAFLDGGDRWLDRVLAGTGEIGLEVAVPGRPEERERILLDVPSELLRIASATIATGFGDPEQEYFADGTATKNSSP